MPVSPPGEEEEGVLLPPRGFCNPDPALGSWDSGVTMTPAGECAEGREGEAQWETEL